MLVSFSSATDQALGGNGGVFACPLLLNFTAAALSSCYWWAGPRAHSSHIHAPLWPLCRRHLTATPCLTPCLPPPPLPPRSDAATLSITMAPDGVVVPGSTLRLLPGLLRAACDPVQKGSEACATRAYAAAQAVTIQVERQTLHKCMQTARHPARLQHLSR